MNNHRYTEIILPINRRVRRLPPSAKNLLTVIEGGLLVVLAALVALYVY